MLRVAFASAYRRRAILLGLTGLTLTWPQAVDAAALLSQADRAFLAWDSRAGSPAAKGGLNNWRSSAVSSSSAGTGQVMPTTPARRRYSATV
jgi:hypothetical protein